MVPEPREWSLHVSLGYRGRGLRGRLCINHAGMVLANSPLGLMPYRGPEHLRPTERRPKLRRVIVLIPGLWYNRGMGTKIGPVEITNRTKPCNCGCKGRDPWHATSYQRVITLDDGSEISGTAHLPFSSDPVAVERVTVEGRNGYAFSWWRVKVGETTLPK